MYYRKTELGEYLIVMQVGESSLVKRVEHDDYVVAKRLDLETFIAKDTFYAGRGSEGLRDAVDFIKTVEGDKNGSLIDLLRM